MHFPGQHPHKFQEVLRDGDVVEDECQGDYYDEKKPGCGRLRRHFVGKGEESSWGRK